jgi:Bifunctional DNA primase/polymerase, N-terminal
MLKETLFSLPDHWQLTPVIGKFPCFKRWEQAGIDRNLIATELEYSATGFGLLTGVISGGIIAIDCDGPTAHNLFKEMLCGEIPHTIAFTSGRSGRAQYLFSVPELFWNEVRTRKVKADQGQMLEFRWNGCQSVLPPSKHPETGKYQWINQPSETIIEILPDKIVQFLGPKPVESSTYSRIVLPRISSSDRIPLENCLSRSHREALNGVSEGSRHDTAVSLIRDLLGSANKLNYLGINHDGDPQQMLWDFASRCTPPMPAREVERIWRWHQNGNWAPSINNEESFSNCIRAWDRLKAA